MRLQPYLEELGFYRVRSGLGELYSLAAAMTSAAGDASRSPRFDALPSFIPAHPAQARRPLVLAVDIGGSSTKLGLRLNGNGGERWVYLFEEHNDALREQIQGLNSTEAFCSVVARRAAAALRSNGFEPRALDACGVVWSNPIQNRRDPERGVLGVIVKRAIYSKNEWFIADLRDGVDIGLLFLDALNAHGFAITSFAITNDTPFTMKAAKAADAGMVASTGLNGTLVKSLHELGLPGDEDVICNGEMGRLPMAQELLSRGDEIRGGKPAGEIEYLSSGAFLPMLFTNHIHRLCEAGCAECRETSEWLRNHDFRGENLFNAADLTCLLETEEDFFERHPGCPNAPGIRDTLRALAHELFARSAALCSVIAFATVSNRIRSERRPVVALDSRLARENKFFWERLQSEAAKAPVPLELQLLEPLRIPDGSISVPMQGAANAVDNMPDGAFRG